MSASNTISVWFPLIWFPLFLDMASHDTLYFNITMVNASGQHWRCNLGKSSVQVIDSASTGWVMFYQLLAQSPLRRTCNNASPSPTAASTPRAKIPMAKKATLPLHLKHLKSLELLSIWMLPEWIAQSKTSQVVGIIDEYLRFSGT